MEPKQLASPDQFCFAKNNRGASPPNPPITGGFAPRPPLLLVASLLVAEQVPPPLITAVSLLVSPRTRYSLLLTTFVVTRSSYEVRLEARLAGRQLTSRLSFFEPRRLARRYAPRCCAAFGCSATINHQSSCDLQANLASTADIFHLPFPRPLGSSLRSDG